MKIKRMSFRFVPMLEPHEGTLEAGHLHKNGRLSLVQTEGTHKSLSKAAQTRKHFDQLNPVRLDWVTKGK